jgi:prepilin-type N-terminal cleavage/methylation domain-containing protein
VINLRALRASRGFTLIEIMVSVLILGVGLVFVANSYVFALRGASFATNNIRAEIIAREKLEALEISSLKEGVSVSLTQGILKSSAKRYDYVQNIEAISQPQDLAKYFMLACLTVSWQERNAIKDVTLATYLSRKQ